MCVCGVCGVAGCSSHNVLSGWFGGGCCSVERGDGGSGALLQGEQLRPHHHLGRQRVLHRGHPGGSATSPQANIAVRQCSSVVCACACACVRVRIVLPTAFRHEGNLLCR